MFEFLFLSHSFVGGVAAGPFSSCGLVRTCCLLLLLFFVNGKVLGGHFFF